jgi:hypothetical protein
MDRIGEHLEPMKKIAKASPFGPVIEANQANKANKANIFDRPRWRSQGEHTPLGVFALFAMA